jgi:hypothetical protein
MSLKKDGKVTITTEVVITKDHFLNLDLKSDITDHEWDKLEEMITNRLHSVTESFYWTNHGEFVVEELEEIRSGKHSSSSYHTKESGVNTKPHFVDTSGDFWKKPDEPPVEKGL